MPTDNPERGIATRARVRFRISLSDFDSDYMNNHLTKILVPHNPKNIEDIDYVFGTDTKDKDDGTGSFRDLFWNNVYTVKSYIPRIQKGNNQRTEKFSGIKNVNVSEGSNNIPYNNMRVNITFMFILQCAIIKILIFAVKIVNKVLYGFRWLITKKAKRRYVTIGDGMCPELEGWYFAPGAVDDAGYYINTLNKLESDEGTDTKSTNTENSDSEGRGICLTNATNYFMQCIEINLAMENNVIQFDFYNDWINGLIYIPRWFVNIRKKGSFLFGLIRVRPKIQACMENTFSDSRRYVQQCAMGYTINDGANTMLVTSTNGCHRKNNKNKCHKKEGRKYATIFRSKGGIIHTESTLKGQSVYYLKPCESLSNGKKCNLYATDIVLLGNINKCNIHGIPSEFDNMASSTYQLPPVLVQSNMNSDGPLYGFGDGTSRCSKNQKNKTLKPLEQDFKTYEKWAMGEEPIEDVTEYAVTEISGIDWGLSGPNQGGHDSGSLYFPGGHFLGIACFNAAVNTKSCTNLSRICELGVMMSQRQSKFSYKKVGDNEYVHNFKYLIPSGFISKDEINDNNFRNIFATLNYNRLKTKKNEYGLREYDFIPLQPINLNGELKKKVNNDKYNRYKLDNPNNDTATNADAYIRTIEESSKDYILFRFGIDGKTRKLRSRFLVKEDGKHYLPSYENSYYFYFGIKNGATALDKFLTDYFAECPTRGEIFIPEIKAEVTDKITCVNEGKVEFEIKNFPTPFNWVIYNEKEQPIGIADNDVEINIFNITGLTPGKYVIEVENTKAGLKMNKEFEVDEVLPSSDIHNFYEDSCKITTVNFDETPIITINGDNIKTSPINNGGIIEVSLPELNLTEKKAPYIYGFAVTCGRYCMCYSNDGRISKIYNLLTSQTNFEYDKLIFTKITIINNGEKNLIDVPDNEIYKMTGTTETYSFKAWQNDMECNLYICYFCDKNNQNELKLKLVDDAEVGINHRKMSYYIYNETTTLSDLEIKTNSTIFEKIKNTDERIVKFNYNNLSALTPEEEWNIKRGLYYDESYFTDATGSIKYGVVGGTLPYEERIIGTSEYLRSDGLLEMVHDVNSITEGSVFPVSITEIKVPTVKWLGGFPNEIGYMYEKKPYNITVKDKNNVVPYIGLLKDNKYKEENLTNNGTTSSKDPWYTGSSGIELVTLIE